MIKKGKGPGTLLKRLILKISFPIAFTQSSTLTRNSKGFSLIETVLTLMLMGFLSLVLSVLLSITMDSLAFEDFNHGGQTSSSKYWVLEEKNTSLHTTLGLEFNGIQLPWGFSKKSQSQLSFRGF